MAFRHFETSLHRIHQRCILRRPQDKSWVLRDIRLFKKSLHQSCFFRCSRYRKWVRMAFRHLDTSLHRIQQSRFLRRPEGWLWVVRVISLRKTNLQLFRQNFFF
jgi:hypothetical protein